MSTPQEIAQLQALLNEALDSLGDPSFKSPVDGKQYASPIQVDGLYGPQTVGAAYYLIDSATLNEPSDSGDLADFYNSPSVDSLDVARPSYVLALSQQFGAVMPPASSSAVAPPSSRSPAAPRLAEARVWPWLLVGGVGLAAGAALWIRHRRRFRKSLRQSARNVARRTTRREIRRMAHAR